MKEKVIVSKEIEGILDTENIFGTHSSGEIPVTIYSPRATVKTNLVAAKVTSHSLKVDFKTKPGDACKILSGKNIDKICIGPEGSEDSIVHESPNVKNLSVRSDSDLYLCRIVIDFTK